MFEFITDRLDKRGLYPYSKALDEAINRLLDEGAEAVSISRLCVSLGGVKLWVGNYPHAYGTLYDREAAGMPRVSTRKRLREYLNDIDRLRALKDVI